MFFYLVPAIGLAVSSHYCGGKLTSFSLIYPDTKKCNCGNKQMEKNCCKDKIQILQLKDDQQKEPQFSFNLISSFDYQLAILYCCVLHVTSNKVINRLYSNNYPPGDLKLPLYIQHSVFRI